MKKTLPPPSRPCWTCRGTGRILVGNGRGALLVCPMCRGSREARS
jgi:hypothetical protein